MQTSPLFDGFISDRAVLFKLDECRMMQKTYQSCSTEDRELGYLMKACGLHSCHLASIVRLDLNDV